MTFIYITIFATVLGISAVCALVWALGSGQMDRLPMGAVSIFDDDEPQGQVTDRFPAADANRDRDHREAQQ